MDKKFLSSLFCASVLVLSACGQGIGGKKQLTIKNYHDSLTVKTGNVECTTHISMDYPEDGNSILVHNIREWILDETDNLDTADIDNAATLTKGYIDGSMENLKDMVKEFDDVQSEMSLSSSLDISRIFENAKFVTFKTSRYEYLGGAHGMSIMTGTTFRKSDGKIFGKNMLDNSKQKDIRKLIMRNLLPYFEVGSIDELRGMLFLPEGETLVPMPAMEPYIDNDNMVFTYQQYEIAPYAAGMPEASIPLKELMPYLSASFKNAYFQ